MTYCCRGFKAAQINVWFSGAMPWKERAVPHLRIQSVMWNDTKLLAVWGMYRDEGKGWERMADWSRSGSDMSFHQIAKKKKLHRGTVLQMQPELCIKLFSTLVFSRLSSHLCLLVTPLLSVLCLLSFLILSLSAPFIALILEKIRKHAKQS